MTDPGTDAHAPPPRRLGAGHTQGQGLRVPGAYGRFWLVERLGAGGMAEVYRAHEGAGAVGRSLVIKRLRPRYLASDSARRLFVEEARLAASIDHPNIVRVFGLEQLERGDVFMTMEHVDGADLRWLLNMARRRRRRLPIWLSLHIMVEVLRALEFLAELEDGQEAKRNVVHCDVTPENVFVSSDGVVKLGDFGVAVEDTRPQDFFLGQLRGKLPYCSPEQASGERLDPRSDVYSAAAVLWECLTGRPLVSLSDEDAARRAIYSPERPRPSTVNPEVSPTLDDIVLAALAPDRGRRTPGAGVLRARLQRQLASLQGAVTREDVVRGMTEALAPRAPGPRAPTPQDGLERMLFAPPPEVRMPTAAELPDPELPDATYVHFDEQAFGPMSLSDALTRLEERACVDLERWAISLDGRLRVLAPDALRILGNDMGVAKAAGPVAFEVSLRVQSLASLFGQVAHTLSSGYFELRRETDEGEDVRILRLADGRLLDVCGARSSLRMWSALTRAQHEHGMAFAPLVHRALMWGRAVHESLPVELQSELRQARLFEVQRQLEELFAWTDGQVSFVPAELPGSRAAPRLDRLVPELVLQTHDEARLVQVLEPYLTKRAFGAPTLEAEMAAIGLLEPEREVVHTLLTSDSLAEGLVAATEEARVVGMAAIYSLHAIGLLRFV